MKTQSIILTILLGAFFSFSAFAQGNCKSWGTGKDSTDAIKNHVLYRDYMKQKEFEKAFPLWEKAYTAAPSGSEKHFIDGVKIYKNKVELATDDAEKQKYIEKVYALFDQRIECFGKEGAILGRKAYNMYYMAAPTEETYKTFTRSIELEGNKSKDFILVPFANNAVDMYRNKAIEKEEAREVYATLNKIIDYNIANNEKKADKYTKAKAGVQEQFSIIERNIFDCGYFRDDIIAKYNADPNNPDVYKSVYKELVQVGCTDADPIVAEIKAKDKSRIADKKAAFQAQQAISREENAPTANKASEQYKAGNYAEAVRLYLVAVDETNVSDKKGRYLYTVAQTYAYKLKSYSNARKYAREAAKHMPGSGKPYMLIGNIYAAGASSCGSKTDDWGSRLAYLAAIDKWNYAKSVDSSLAGEVSEKVAKYASYKPTKEQAFLRGLKDGQSANTGCWIGESVTVRTVKGY